jgi:outer membrane protein OmpA-like peptidoglycan-associated protein
MFTRATPALLLTGCLSSLAAADISQKHDDPIYVGLGLGMSFLQPETNSVALTLSEDSDIAYKLFAGYRFNQSWSLEAFWANLGEAVVSSTSGSTFDIEYKTFGAGVLYSYPLNERWDVFAKAGAGRLQNNVRGIAVERVEDYFIYGGVGVTWNMAETWDLRAEYEYFDSDAQLLSFNVIKRFGLASSKRVRKLEQQVSSQNAQLAAATATQKQPGCENFAIELHGVRFTSGSIVLSDDSKKALDAIVERMLALPADIRFEIRAHTDDTGTELYNYTLSLSRARNVRDYLVTQGVPQSRIDAHGYGEWRPRATNDSEAGRRDNRRAELVLIGLENHVENVDSCPNVASDSLQQ